MYLLILTQLLMDLVDILELLFAFLQSITLLLCLFVCLCLICLFVCLSHLNLESLTQTTLFILLTTTNQPINQSDHTAMQLAINRPIPPPPASLSSPSWWLYRLGILFKYSGRVFRWGWMPFLVYLCVANAEPSVEPDIPTVTLWRVLIPILM